MSDRSEDYGGGGGGGRQANLNSQESSKSSDTILDSNGLMEFAPLSRSSVVNLHIPMHLFGLVEETERRWPCLR